MDFEGSVRPVAASRAAMWTVIVLTIAASLVGTPRAGAENLMVDITTVTLEGEASDLEIDPERNLAYLSLTDQDEIVVIDVTARTIIGQHSIPKPVGLSLSADGKYLYVALYQTSGIARVDLTDWSRTNVVLTELGDPRTHDVAEIAPGVVLVTASPSSNGSAYVVRYDFTTGIEDVVASNRNIRARPRINVDDDRHYAYVGEGFSPNSLYKLDLSSPEIDIVAEDQHGQVGGTELFAIAPEGNFVVTSGGQKLRTSDLVQVGSYEQGTPVFSDDGAILYSLPEPNVDGILVSVADAETTALIEQWQVACPGGSNQPLAATAGSDLIAASLSYVCFIHTETARLRPLPAGGRFFDDDDIVHEASIEAIAIEGITTGCNPQSTGFCPNDPVTRGQMAAFLSRALDLPGGGASAFIDDNHSVFEGDITRLAAAGITKGCNPPENTMFCPEAVVTRAQMAAFLTRAMGYAQGAVDNFEDDDGSVFEADIDALASARVTLGCNPPSNTRFCPNQPVTRAQMATFMARALDLRIRETTSRPATTIGTDLELISRAEAGRCSGVSESICETTAYNVRGEFYILTGWFAEDWSSTSQAEQRSFTSSAVRLEASFDGVPIDLVQWPLEVVDDTAHKVYTFQFPDWLTDVHRLDVRFLDETIDYIWTVRVNITMISGQPGYLNADVDRATQGNERWSATSSLGPAAPKTYLDWSTRRAS
ncbi:MAG: hypothetical protein GY722_21545 [bacterium]|nr:hypothetical protein [bacterium]